MNQNVPVSAETSAVHDGYLSEESKKKFTITAGILGAVFFFLQFFAPFFAMMLVFPAFFLTSFRITEYDVTRGAVHDNHLYFFAEKEGPGAKKGSSNLVRLDLRKVPATDVTGRGMSKWWFPHSIPKNDIELEEIAGVDDDSTWLLADDDRLLLISQTKIEELRDGRFASVGSYPSLGNISRPFYYEGSPAVVEGRPNGIFLAVFEGGTWRRTRIFLEKEEDYRDVERFMQVVSIDGTSHVFLKVGKTLFHRIGLPLERSSNSIRDWQTVGSCSYGWSSYDLNGNAAVLLWDRNKLRGFRLKGTRWSEFFNTPPGFPADNFLPLPPIDGSLRFAISRMPFSFGVYSIEEDKLILNSRFGRGFPFPSGLMAMMFIPHIANMMFPVILAIILSGLMLHHRVSSHSFGGETAQFASLTRRAFAQVIDAIILAAGMLPFVLQFFNMFEMMESDMESFMFPIYFFGTFALSFVWALLLLLIFSLTEGAWGVTPGKWLLGIRVIGTDLKPCGFWRALLRNFLKVVDGFFNFMVGILIVAFTKDWQRVGDMAARTIVIRKAQRYW